MNEPHSRNRHPCTPSPDSHQGVAGEAAACSTVSLPATLRHDNTLFEKILDVAAVMILVLDRNGDVVLINRHGAEMLGGTPEEIAGKNWFDHFLPQDCVAEVRVIFSDLITGRTTPHGQVEGRLVTLAGEERCMIWHNTVLHDELGRVTATVSSGADVTEHRREEAELHQIQRLDAVGRLAGGIAHDFNNILAAILGYAEMAAGEVSGDNDLTACLEGIMKAGRRARDLVRQILSFSRQQVPADRRPVLLAGVLDEARALLRASLPATIEIRTNVNAHEAQVLGDSTRLEQILVNLGTNAAHAMREAGGILEINLDEVDASAAPSRCSDETGDRPCVRLTVRDTGCGMDESTLARAFDPFFTTRPHGEGTGLGLSVVHGIVNQMGGFVQASSRLGEGSLFEIFLPRASSAVPELRSTALPSDNAESVRLLFVEDEASLAQLAKQLLERIGHRVTVFTSGAEALDCFRQNPAGFDLLITDMTMPSMTGDVLAREIRRIRPDIPIILCTGYSENLIASRTEEIGVGDVLLKPFTVGEIDACIRQVMGEPIDQSSHD